ncbi:hypothetical protein DBR42_15335 [Pelomonas sp. HMWF004]|nr:hypothetical protein DBR42_15335 [Pelomonas sp. HMWF004]
MRPEQPSPRAPRGAPEYWAKWCCWQEGASPQIETELQQPSGDLTYRPQYVPHLARHHLEMMLRLYSAGARVSTMASWFEDSLSAWEESQRLEPTVYPPEVVGGQLGPVCRVRLVDRPGLGAGHSRGPLAMAVGVDRQ